MKIVIYGINYKPELTGIGRYTSDMAEWMAAQGHDVHVITTPPYYPEWQVHRGYSAWRYRKEVNGNLTVYRTPIYIPTKPSTLNRLIHLSSFALSSLFPLLAQGKWKPDRIIAIAPTLIAVPGMLMLSRLTRAKTVLHIQDFEVDAMLGLGMASEGRFARLARAFEKKCLCSVDYVSLISHSMVSQTIKKGVCAANTLFFPNWTEIECFLNVDEMSVDILRHQLGLATDKKIVLYSGNIGEKQGLETVISVAEQLQDQDIIFLIIGEGAGKARLEKSVTEKQLTRVVFKPLQPYEQLPALLKMADCHLVIQRKGAADAVLPSKLTNILAVGGNAVITAEKDTELGRLCLMHKGIATCVEPESFECLLSGITYALTLPKYNAIAQEYARRSLDKENILSQFIADIRG